MATVTVIPAKPMQELKGLEATAKLRVCAYARVQQIMKSNCRAIRRRLSITPHISGTIQLGNLLIFSRMRELVVPTLRSVKDSIA